MELICKQMVLLGWRIDWPDPSIGVIGNTRWCGVDDFAHKDRCVARGAEAVELWGSPSLKPVKLKENQKELVVFVQKTSEDVAELQEKVPMVNSSLGELKDFSSHIPKKPNLPTAELAIPNQKGKNASELKAYWDNHPVNNLLDESQKQHPSYPRTLWAEEAMSHKTILLYWDWVVYKMKVKND